MQSLVCFSGSIRVFWQLILPWAQCKFAINVQQVPNCALKTKAHQLGKFIVSGNIAITATYSATIEDQVIKLAIFCIQSAYGTAMMGTVNTKNSLSTIGIPIMKIIRSWHRLILLIETVSAGGRSARPARLSVHPIWWRWHGNTES